MSDWGSVPVTKLLDLTTLVAHVLWRNSGPSAGPSATSKASLLWRFTTSNVVTVNTHELVFCLLLIYQFRLIERRLGTAKYAAFVIFAAGLAWPLRLYLLQHKIAGVVASGPYAVIFACFPLLLREVPGCTTFQLGPAGFSDRMFYYVIGLQLAVSSAASRWAASIGIVVGLAYLMLGRRGITVPKPIANIVGGIMLPILDPPPTLSRREQLQRDMERVRNERIAARGGSGGSENDGAEAGAEGNPAPDGLRQRRAPANEEPEALIPGATGMMGDGGAAPSEEDIAQLQAICSRGRIDVIAALQRNNNNVEAAADWLLSHIE